MTQKKGQVTILIKWLLEFLLSWAFRLCSTTGNGTGGRDLSATTGEIH